MAGTINSLGIGSGVLTSELIDKLREADESVIIKPLENKITLANQKEDAYDLLSTLMTTFKASASALDGDNLYLSRAVTGNTDAVTVSAESGSNVQEFSITDINRAEADVWTLPAFDATNLGDGTFSLKVGGEKFDIDYKPDSTLESIKNAINEEASSKVTASLLNTGKDAEGNDKYELVITAKETNEKIGFSDSNMTNNESLLKALSLDARDVWTSQSLDNTNLGDGKLTLTVGGKGLEIGYSNTSTLEEIKNAINASAEEEAVSGTGTVRLTASILDNELVITATNMNEAITFSDDNSDPDASLLKALNLNEDVEVDDADSKHIQTAKSATFKYNGIEISRDSNEIDDLIVGVTINLNQNQEAGDIASIDIAQNSTAISTEMSLFVNNYNSLMTNLQDMTRSDRETGSVGIFNSESFVKSISRDIVRLVTQVDGKGNSLIDYGISLDRDGVMSLDNDVFAHKFVTDPEGMELFFSGDSETDGLFTKLDTKMNGYTGYNQLLSSFSDQLESSKDNLVNQYDKQQASLDSRYEIMQQRFIAYDAIISRINAQFASLQMMINAEANKD